MRFELNGQKKKELKFTNIILSIIDCETPSIDRFDRLTRNASSDEPTTTSNVCALIRSRSDSISS